MNVRVLMALFVVSWGLWACMPLWGSAVFAALEVAVLFGVAQKNQAGRAAVRGEYASVASQLEPDARTFLEKHAFFYTSRAQATEWAKLLRAVGLASLLLVPVFAIHAFIRSDLRPLIAIGPAGLFFLLNAILAPALEVDEQVKQDGKAAERALHEAVAAAVKVKHDAAVASALSAAPTARLGPPPSARPPDAP